MYAVNTVMLGGVSRDRDEKKLGGFGMGYRRTILKVKWPQQIRNNDIHQRTSLRRS